MRQLPFFALPANRSRKSSEFILHKLSRELPVMLNGRCYLGLGTNTYASIHMIRAKPSSRLGACCRPNTLDTAPFVGAA
jgi:hypothetical protein